ncbi:MAG: ComEC/Rec2 family competence protein [Patescibacteria group bacterium]
MIHTTFFTDVINLYLPEPHASLLNGIIFGTKLRTSKDFILEVKRVGLTHLVVLSGMNITIMCSVISLMTAKLSKRLAVVITIISIVIFIGFVGVQAPAVRAAIMSILTLVAILYGRKTLALYTLVVSGVISLLLWPKWLTSISFHLSYAATLGLILFAREIKTPDKSTRLTRILHYCKSELATSLAAQAFTVPLIFIYFKQISVIAPLSNLAVSWVVTPVMIFGFLTAVLGKLNFYLGLVPSYICYVLLSYMIYIIHWMAQLPYIFFSF